MCMRIIMQAAAGTQLKELNYLIFICDPAPASHLRQATTTDPTIDMYM